MLQQLLTLAKAKRLPPIQLWVGNSDVLRDNLDQFIQSLLGKGVQPHPNLFALVPLDDKKEITMEPTRELLYFLKTTPTLPTWRIVTIRQAELLNRQATNALLKILEAPPKDTLVILLCGSQGKLLPTLLSRCTKMSFGGTQEADLDPAVMQQLGKLMTTMAARGTASIQESIDAVADTDCPRYVDALRPFLHKLLTSIKGHTPPSKGLQQLLTLAPHSKWVEAYTACSDYLDQAVPAHLPMREILRGALYLIRTPSLAYGMRLS
jgi:hypothetical protein